MQEDATVVTAAGIARLAGVGRAAVSNWRRRHGDFPKPVGGTETSPAFLLAEVEQWLRRQGKLVEVPLRERVWQQVAGHRQGTAAALVQAGCVLLLVHERPTRWLELAAGSDERLAALLPADLAHLLALRLGPDAPAAPDAPALASAAPMLRGVAELAAANGPRHTYEFLLDRYADARHHALTPPGLAGLMADLATAHGPDRPGSPRVVLDPACGTGALLRAAARPHPGQVLHGQDSAPALAALAALRLALHTPGPVRVTTADTLRADAVPSLRADVVLCHPPFNERNWGHEDLAHDPRWRYGFPARTESELAWVQHALARLHEGGTAVLLMPPAAASRRSGRRIRADLLRRGALRAVIALPAGSAPPHGLPLHLWILRRPGRGPVPAQVLMADTTDVLAPEARAADLSAAGNHVSAASAPAPSAPAPSAPAPPAPASPAPAPSASAPPGADASVSGVLFRPGRDCGAVREVALGLWRSFDRDGTLDEWPGVARAVTVIDLLDDDVDLTPARHLPPPVTAQAAEQLTVVRERLGDTLRLTADLAPLPPSGDAPAAGGPGPVTTVGELVRGGVLTLLQGGAGGRRGARVLTDHDVVTGAAPSGTLPEDGTGEDEPVVTRAGDVVLPVTGGEAVARVIGDGAAGVVLGRNLVLLRPDPGTLDPWFLAGFLRGTANQRRASSFASTATRLDVRRLRVPRLPLEDQRRHGERFRALDEFEAALRQAAALGTRLVRGSYDALTDGVLAPH
ncbi:N-6 DNA methylase [Streptomyces fragilis]|uniref:N-6 DNA methylase n=1 Tax=Streptomyces fragilis TaxID=67301 RepID=A0ABV2YFU4_9ACTN|nr:N-6 DNA methylase [Streptomyces fragilis]